MLRNAPSAGAVACGALAQNEQANLITGRERLRAAPGARPPRERHHDGGSAGDRRAAPQASQASALEVRAAVRSLRADYLESGDAVSRAHARPVAARARAPSSAKPTPTPPSISPRPRRRRGEPTCGRSIDRLRRHDAAVTNRIEDKLLALAGRRPPPRRERVYLTRYLARARRSTCRWSSQALRLASDEVAAAARLTQSRRRRARCCLAWRHARPLPASSGRRAGSC